MSQRTNKNKKIGKAINGSQYIPGYPLGKRKNKSVSFNLGEYAKRLNERISN